MVVQVLISILPLAINRVERRAEQSQLLTWNAIVLATIRKNRRGSRAL